MSDTLQSNQLGDRHRERGKQWLEQLLKLAQFPVSVKADVQAIPDADEPSDGYWLTIDETKLTPAQIQSLIGHDGVVLDAIQYLANATLNMGQEREQQASYTIELNGYRLQREAELRVLAEGAVQQVRETGQEVEMKSLSSAERRQIHTLLKDYEDLETYSRGQEPDRRLVIKLRSY